MSISVEKPEAGAASWFNVPNQITSVRLILAIVVFAGIALEQFALALVLFVIAASTDWLDGYWARRFHQVTKLGRIFDPFVDKFIICGVFIFLAAEPRSGIAAWVAVVVTARELLVTALRGEIEGAGGDFSAKRSGKWKMLLQCAAVSASLATMVFRPPPPNYLAIARDVCVWAALVLTIYSGLVYVLAAIRILKSSSQKNHSATAE